MPHGEDKRGDEGIRTLGPRRVTRSPGVPISPLSHVSAAESSCAERLQVLYRRPEVLDRRDQSSVRSGSATTIGPMAYLSLYRKYRPQTFDDLLGQEHVSSTLAKAITEDRVSHAYLFTGPRGTGKTSTARILAKALNCEKGPTPSPCGKCASCVAITDGSSLDVIEMDAASHSKVDDAREILAGVPLASAGSRKKVYVIDEVHMLSTQAFNALLKTLEEPPSHVVFILATTEAHKVLPTIISRTQRFDFRRVSQDDLTSHLEKVAKSEGMDVEPSSLQAVARHSEGSVRDALSALDQLSNLGEGASSDDVHRFLGQRTHDSYLQLFDAVAAGDVGELFARIGAFMAQGADPRQLAEGALQHVRSLLLLATAPDAEALLDANEEDRQALTTQAGRFSPGLLVRVMDLLGKAITEMRNAPNHRLFLEVALVRAAAPDTDPTATGLLGRIERLERRMGIEQPGEQGAPAATATDLVPTAPKLAPSPVATAGPAEEVKPDKGLSLVQDAPTGESPNQEAGASSDAPGGDGSPPSSTVDGVGLGHMRDAWPATLAEVNKRSKRVWALLNPSQPLRFDGELLTVEVQSEFHMSSMSSEGNRSMLADSLFAALGVRPGLAFEQRADAGEAQPPVQALQKGKGKAEQPKSAAPPRDEDLEANEIVADAEEDPIELVKQGFGAEVVEEKRPDTT